MRKWTYLVAALLMAGTTATFTGCIDTDEPEGITNLRGAKSELIKAQAAVKLVEVEWQKAQVAYQELMNKSKELSNQYQEYDNQMHALDVKLKELEVERMQALTDQAKAEADAKIAEANRDKAYWENKMKEEAEIFKASLLKYQTQTAQAQEAYDNAMKLIEAGKLLLSDGEKAIIDKAQQRLFVASASLQKYYKALKTAQDGYDVAIMAKKTRTLPQLEATLKLAQLAVERQEKVVKEYERLLALADEFNSVNWDAEVQGLDKQIQDAKVEQGKAEKKKAEIINNEEYHKAAANLALEKDTLGTENDDVTEKTAWGIYNKAKADSSKQSRKVALKIKKYESEPINAALIELFANAPSTPSGYTNGVFSYNQNEDTYTQSAYNKDAKARAEAEDPTTYNPQSLPLQLEAQVEAWIKFIEDFGVSDESVAQQQALLKGKKDAAKKAADAYTKALAEWQVLVNAVSSNGTKLETVPTDKDEAADKPSIKKAKTAYNDAITALGKAVEAYNKAYDDVYKKKYDESIAKAKDNKYIEELKKDIADQQAWDKFNQDKPNATPAEKIAKLEELVIPSAATAAKTKAEDYVKTDGVKNDAIDEATQAWTNSKEKTENTKAVDTAAEAAQKAYDALPAALTRYDNLAKNYFGQVLNETIKWDDITGKGISFVGDDSDAAGHKKMLKTAISDDNFTKLTAVKYDETTARTSLLNLSKLAFGNVLGVYNGEGRLTEVEPEEVREYAKTHTQHSVTDDLTNNFYGYLGAQMGTADAVQLCEDLIAAKDKLDEVKTMLEGILADLKAEIKANDAKMVPFIEAATKAWADVKKAKDDVDAAEEVKIAYTRDIDAEILSWEALVTDLEAIQKELKDQITSITGKGYTAEQYVDAWKQNVALAEQTLANRQMEVEVAEESIELYKAGKYTLAYNVEKAQLKMEKVQEAYEVALGIYNKALADVKTILETLTK